MGIGRQKERDEITTTKKVVEKIVIKHSDHPQLTEEEFLEGAVKKTKEIWFPAKKTEETKPVITGEVEKEEIELLKAKERKSREDKKELNDVALVGTTIEAKDFRAICKKNGLQINIVLSEVLRDWNMAHYNL